MSTTPVPTPGDRSPDSPPLDASASGTPLTDARSAGAASPGSFVGSLFGMSVAKGGPGGGVASSGTPRATRASLSVDAYVAGVRACDRAILGRTISLVESSNPRHEATAQEVLRRLLPFTGHAMRVGITGVPGAGKSTFIEKLGTSLCRAGRRVAVLAVDPSSGVSGGSILGDKTRMATLSAEPSAFIRPSPSGGTLGGVARKTRETMLVCEAAGFEVMLVKTVGVGQSETVVADMTDFFLAIMIAGAGDELQGIKRGLLELVDMIAVNKADGDNEPRARIAAREYANAVRLTSRSDPEWDVPVLTCSATTGAGIEEAWERIKSRIAAMRTTGRLATLRREQDLRWMRALLEDRLHRLLSESVAASAELHASESQVRAGTMPPAMAADRIVAALREELRGGHARS
ncbi:MAG: methylmalonyl Co-A mutase-associated GTPase MeaB [Planctomycetota bacterium]|nr:methylmalonyl Co-A mutase-associated GTPase MeaB [Planctomycetota bacterium]